MKNSLIFRLFDVKSGDAMKFMDDKLRKRHKKMIVASIVCVIVISAMYVRLFESDRVYTHLFYIPIAMTAVWMPKWTIFVGVCLSLYHVLLEAMIVAIFIPSNYMRSAIIIIIAIILNEICKYETNYQNEITKLTYTSSHDALTKLHNRGYFDMTLSSELNKPVTVIIIDIDGLKNINDTYGHLAGDAYIIETSRILHQSLRLGDTLARIGGDEFGIIAQSCGEEGAMDVLNRIEIQLSDYNRKSEDSKHISISIGYKVNDTSEDIQVTYNSADKIMYENKKRKYEVGNETAKRRL